LTNVLVVGVPRSGTSWIGQVLGSTPGAVYLSEPDNHEHVPFAVRAKSGLPGRFYPHLPAGFEAPAYEFLWRAALEGGDSRATFEGARRRLASRLLKRATSDDVLESVVRPSDAPLGLRVVKRIAIPERPAHRAENLVVKSVHAQLALEWLAARFPIRVVLVLRDPLSVLSSWKTMGWLASGGALDELGRGSAAELERELRVQPSAGGAALADAAQLIALLTSALLEAARRRPEWQVAAHEELCERPHDSFPQLAHALGLGWDASVDGLLDELNRPGTGYDTTRVSSGLADVWRQRLTDDEVRAASEVFDRFELEWATRS
jgi:hypothetical protein